MKTNRKMHPLLSPDAEFLGCCRGGSCGAGFGGGETDMADTLLPQLLLLVVMVQTVGLAACSGSGLRRLGTGNGISSCTRRTYNILI
jgi:hypothetical protein